MLFTLSILAFLVSKPYLILGQFIANCTDPTVRLLLWDMNTKILPDAIPYYRGPIIVVNNEILIIGQDTSLIAWNFTSQTQIYNIINAHTENILLIEKYDSNIITVSQFGVGTIRDPLTGSVTKTIYLGEINGLKYLNFIITMQNNTVSTRKSDTGDFEYTLQTNTPVRSIEIIPPMNYVATGMEDGTIKFWNVPFDSIPLKTLNGHSGPVRMLKILSDGSLASSSDDYSIKIWNTTDGTLMKTLVGHKNRTSALVRLENGSLISGSWDQTIVVWDFSTDPGCALSIDNCTNIIRDNYASIYPTTIYATTAAVTTVAPATTASSNVLTTISLQVVAGVLNSLITNGSTTLTSMSLQAQVFLVTQWLSGSSIDLAKTDITTVVDLLTSKFDVSNCIRNCSNRGVCKYISGNALSCICIDNFTVGNSCEVDIRPCSKMPCLNNSTCVENMTSLSYKCECDNFYYGDQCENKVNVCQNETCSMNGNCNDLHNKPTCDCYYLFNGEKCQIQSEEKKTVRRVMVTTSIIAIIIIVLFYVSIVVNDLTTVFARKKEFFKRIFKSDNSKIN